MEDRKIDERLQQIFKIQPLQAKCIAYRTATNEYRKMMKQSCVADIRNLVNVEMALDHVEIKIPDDKRLPPMPTEALRKPKIDELLTDIKMFDECLRLL